MDVFTWSLPFVGEKITDMLIAILNTCSKEELDDDRDPTPPDKMPPSPDKSSDPESTEVKRRAIKNKILAIGRLSRVFQVLREESERVTELKTASGGRLPAGTLMLGAEGIKQAIHNFEDARKVDLQNERLPPTHDEVSRKSLEDRKEALERANHEADNDPGLTQIARRISVKGYNRGPSGMVCPNVGLTDIMSEDEAKGSRLGVRVVQGETCAQSALAREVLTAVHCPRSMPPLPSLFRAPLSRTFQSYVCPLCRYRSISSVFKRRLDGPNREGAPSYPPLKRAVSTTASISVVNARQEIPPTFQPLYEALKALERDAAVYINLSQLKLALRGLETENAVTRVAVLANSSQHGARRLVRALLADPLSSRPQWEQDIMNLPQDGKTLLLRYAEHPDLDSRHPHIRAYSIPSPTLQTHKLEILIQAAARQKDHNVVTYQDLLVPSLETSGSSSGRVSTVTYPVHKTILYLDGLDNLAALAPLTINPIPDDRTKEMIMGAIDGSWEGLNRGHGAHSIINLISSDRAEKAIDSIRDSLGNSFEFEHAWLDSGLPEISKWLLEGTEALPAVLKPSVERIIGSIAASADAAVVAEEDEWSKRKAAVVIPVSTRDFLNGIITEWAEKAHTELRGGLDVAFNSPNWHKLAWWKLFWRADDVAYVALDVLQRSWLPECEKAIIYIAGRIEQASWEGHLKISQQSSSLHDEPRFDPSTRQTGTFPPPPALSDIIPQVPVPEQHDHPAAFVIGTSTISQARVFLVDSTIPPLRLLSQQLVVHSLSTTILTSSLSVLLYVSITSTSLFEAGSIAAIGLVYSLRRLQKKWETARSEWKDRIIEEGRLALKQQEDEWRAVVEDGGSPIEIDEQEVEIRAKAKRALQRVRDTSTNMER
ncbi:MAG: hypothetical protein Q9214_004787 [Letrouitia sp. 1 TL-2023]